MAATTHRPISSPPTKSTALLLLLLLLPPASAQSPPASPATNSDDPYNTSVSPALAILVVAIVSAFFLLGFFSIYLRRCAGDNSAVAPAILAGIGAAGRSRRGLEKSLLEALPTMVYASVKGRRLGKETLECAVCLCEFEDEDTLRLLPRCSHVFHRDCIDVWLAAHATCPVCRRNLAAGEEEEEGVSDLEEGRNPDLADLVRIGSQRREAAAGGKRMPVSSGDWAAVVGGGGGGGERYRLRLPEDVRRGILEAGELRRSASFAVFGGRGGGGWRSMRIGRSGRWPILGRSFSGGAVAPAKGGEGGGGKNDVSSSSAAVAVDLV